MPAFSPFAFVEHLELEPFAALQEFLPVPVALPEALQVPGPALPPVPTFVEQ